MSSVRADHRSPAPPARRRPRSSGRPSPSGRGPRRRARPASTRAPPDTTRRSPAPSETTRASRPPRTGRPAAPPRAPRHANAAADPGHAVALLVARQPRRGMHELRRAPDSAPRSHRSTPPRRRRTSSTSRSTRPIALATARRCAASICARRYGPDTAHNADTDFGALNVKSIPATRDPSPPTAPDRLARHRRAALHQRHQRRRARPRRPASRPSRASASGEPCQRPASPSASPPT